MPPNLFDAARPEPPAYRYSTRFAYGLAYVVNPLILPPLLLGLVLGHFDAPADEIGRVVGIGFVFFGLVPLGYVLWMLRRNQIASLEIRDRRRRTRPFLVGITSYLAALFLLSATGSTAVRLTVALAACFVINTVFLLLVNLRWKISVHTAALAGFTSILLFVADASWPDPAGAPSALLQTPSRYSLLLLLVLLMWARVHVGAHTRGQVAAGALAGLALPYVELHVLLQAGLLQPF